MVIRDDTFGFKGLTKNEYEQMKKVFESNGLAIRVTEYHGSDDTYDVQAENPYQIHAKHFSHLSATQIHEYSLKDIKNYSRR